MLFSDRVKLVSRYRKWLKDESKNKDYKIADAHETMLAFLEYNGLLKDPSPVCVLMRSQEDCDYYERENNYTCDFSDRCASCKYNREL